MDPCAKLRGTASEHRSKRAGEGFVSLITGIKGNLRDRLIRRLQSACCPLQPQATHMLRHRFADHPAKHMMKMIWREMCQPGKIVTHHRLIKMPLQMDQDAKNSLLICLFRIGPDCSIHFRELR